MKFAWIYLMVVAVAVSCQSARDFGSPNDGTGGGAGEKATGDGDGDGDAGGATGDGDGDGDNVPDAACRADAVRCKPGVQVPQVCDDDGEWQSQAACQFACLSGSCGGVCTPGAGRCDEASGVPQTCNDAGEWKNESACGANKVCAAGDCLCTSALTACSDTCADLETSPDHCGACGHSCLGGACIDSVCQPLELASGQTYAGNIVVDDTHVYWRSSLDGGSAHRVPKSGGAVELLAWKITVGSSPQNPTIAVSDNHVFWASLTHIVRANLDGSENGEFEPIEAYMRPRPLFADRESETLYWIEDDEYMFMSKAFTSSGSAIAVSDEPSSSFTLAGGCLYYTTLGTTPWLREICSGKAPFGRVSEAGMGLSVEHAADETSLFFRSQIGIRRLPLHSTGVPTTITTGQSIQSVIVDESFVYYIDGSQGGAPACTSNWSLMRVGKQTGSTPTTLIPAPMACPSSLTMDEDALYWRNADEDTIIKMAKPLP